MPLEPIYSQAPMIPVDHALKGFSQAFDMAVMKHEITSCMPWIGSVHSCRLERFRYRKQNRASFLYELETSNGLTWITGSLYASGKASGTHKSTNKDMGYIPKLDMLLERFPKDRNLGFIEEIMRGDRKTLEAALLPCFGTGWAVLISKATPVRYRPRLAAVFKIEAVGTKDTQTIARNFFVKCYAHGDVAQIFAELSLDRDGSNYSLLHPAAVIKQANTILWPEAKGQPLATYLSEGKFQGQFTQGALALAEFHQSQQSLPLIAPNNFVHKESTKHASFIVNFMPALSNAIDFLSSELSLSFGDRALGPIHYDMKPEHVFIDGKRSTLIDIEGLALCDPALDVGNMLARLEAGWWLNKTDKKSCVQAMAEFLDGSLPLSEQRVAAAFALGKMKTATFAISHQIDDWQRIAAHEITLAVKILQTKSLTLN